MEFYYNNLKTKAVSYKGVKADLPENVSISAFKGIVEICGNCNEMQPLIYLLSRKLYPLQKKLGLYE